MKTFLVILLGLTILEACTPKEKAGNDYTVTDSTITEVVKNPIPDVTTETPLDTITATDVVGKNLNVLILSYYDSLEDKPIREFEVRESSSNKLIFHSSTKTLFLGEEIDPIEGRYDSIKIIPIYYISSQNPLKVNLEFLVDGNFMIGYFKGLTCEFQKELQGRVKLLQYMFSSSFDNNVQSHLQFVPHKCEMKENDILKQFNKLKDEGLLDTEMGGEALKGYFICYLNGRNPNYSAILEDYKQTKYGGYYYYIYVVYLDEFIINPIFQ